MTENSNNALIAEFMGIPKCGRCEDCGAYQYSAVTIYHPSEMKYHTSWDWLMPCLQKAKSLLNGTDNIVLIDRVEWLCNSLIPVDIGHTYMCLIKFITWYNQQK